MGLGEPVGEVVTGGADAEEGIEDGARIVDNGDTTITGMD